MKIANRRRTGFTLIELLVAAALSILIMAIMATAFQTGLGTLSTLKSLGDMAERSKTAETMLRADLEAEHFASVGGGDSPAPMRVSDVRYESTPPSTPPTGGYFQIFQSQPSVTEGNDADGMPSSRAGAGENHRLSMTVKRNGRTPEQLFTSDLSQLTNPTEAATVRSQSVSDSSAGNIYVSYWAQVDWFLDGSRPSTIDGVQTWPLVRRVRGVGQLPTPLTSAQDTLSVTPAGQFSTMQTLAVPATRSSTGANAAAIQNASAKVGDDIVITNVLSFEVRALYSGMAPINPDPLFADLPGGPNAQYDTGLGANGTNRIRVVGVQVKIRVYDTKNKLTRQLTVVSRL